MDLWIVGQYRGETENPTAQWEFQGVFDSREKAVSACRNWSYFIAPAVLNQSLPDETVDMSGAEYPIPRLA